MIRNRDAKILMNVSRITKFLKNGSHSINSTTKYIQMACKIPIVANRIMTGPQALHGLSIGNSYRAAFFL